MFYGLSHVEVPVRDLEASQKLYRDATGFQVKRKGDGYVDLEGGAVVLRLVASSSAATPARIRLQVADVPAAVAALCGAGARAMYEPMRTPELEELAVLRDVDGNVLIPWRALTEDEYDFVPALPKERGWDRSAEDLMQSLLGHVPALFRALARRKVTRVAEELAEETSGGHVDREHVIRGFILASAKVTRSRARGPLVAHGIDPESYRADFEA